MRAEVSAFLWGGKLESTVGVAIPVLKLNADVDKTGVYDIWIRAKVNNDAQDSLWFAVNDTQYIQAGLTINDANEQGEYKWTKVYGNNHINLAAGRYTIAITPREAGGVIDEIVIVSDLNWTPPIEGTDMSDIDDDGSLTVNITGDLSFDVTATAGGVIDTGKTFSLTYNAEEITLVDLAVQQYGAQLTVGMYGGIAVTSVTGGSIVFSVSEAIPDGGAWSGLLSIFRFESVPEFIGQTELRLELMAE